MKDEVIVFDLDDTLYNEIDFLKSAFKEISLLVARDRYLKTHQKMLDLYYSGSDVFDYIVNNYPEYKKSDLIFLYRNHFPTIQTFDGVVELLNELSKNYYLAIITDGRSITQRNKIKALKLEAFIDECIISDELGSEKPDIKNFEVIQNKFNCEKYTYVADNVLKDFISPNNLGWRTIGIRNNGFNIVRPCINLTVNYQPDFWVESFKDLSRVLL